MASLAEKYVFERLAMLEKEHDEHLKGTSATTEKEPENTVGIEFKKEPLTAVRYATCGSWCFEEKDYAMGDIDALKSALELDDEGLYIWATKEYSGGTIEQDDGAKEKAIADIRVSIKRAIDRLEREEEDSDE